MVLTTHIRHLYRWLKAVLFWFLEPRLFWLTLSVVVVTLLFVVRKDATEPEIRITGLILQILGITTVAWGIRETRKLFGRPNIFELSRSWFRRVPVYGEYIVSGSINGTLSGVEGYFNGYVLANADPDASIEERIEALEKNIKHINNRIDTTRTEMIQKLHSQTSTFEQEKQIRIEQYQNLSTKLEATETGGLHISAMGVLWLFVGVILSTTSVELTAWLN